MLHNKKLIAMLGGGQLGLMFVEKAQLMGKKVLVLDPDPDCPAGKIADKFINADYLDSEALRIIIESCMFIFATINFSHMAILMFIFSVLLCVSITLLTSEPDYKKIVGLSFGTLTDEQRIENKNSYDTIDIVLSVILVVLIIGVLSYFTG